VGVGGDIADSEAVVLEDLVSTSLLDLVVFTECAPAD
jgi:hypothetical protein